MYLGYLRLSSLTCKIEFVIVIVHWKTTWCIKEPLWCLLRIHSNVSNVDYMYYSIEVVLWFPFSLLLVGEWLENYLAMCVSFPCFNSLSAYFINECWFTVLTDMVASTIWQWKKRVCLWTSIILGAIQSLYLTWLPNKESCLEFHFDFYLGDSQYLSGSWAELSKRYYFSESSECAVSGWPLRWGTRAHPKGLQGKWLSQTVC